MATAAINNTAVKVFLLDNRALGMVHQWQAVLPRALSVYDSRPGARLLVKPADAFTVGKASASKRFLRRRGFAIARMLASEKPYLPMLPFCPTRTCIPWLRRALRLTT